MRVRNARWTPLYDARLDTGAKDRKPALELVRRAEITQNTGEDWSNVALSGFDRANRAWRQRARPEVARRSIPASTASDGRGLRIGLCDALGCDQPRTGRRQLRLAGRSR